MNAVVRRKKERKTGILPGPMTALVLCMHGLLLMQAGLYPPHCLPALKAAAGTAAVLQSTLTSSTSGGIMSSS
jgi:hypothetical protein